LLDKAFPIVYGPEAFTVYTVALELLANMYTFPELSTAIDEGRYVEPRADKLVHVKLPEFEPFQ
jgi:hypothetical protein